MTVYDLVVIGAGPAGMSAAFVAGEAGLRVAIVDAAPRMGGQYYRHPPPEFHVDSPHTLHHDWSRFVALREDLRRTGAVVHLPDHHVWAVERVGELITVHAVADQRSPVNVALTGRSLLVATGGHDRQLPFPGWELPGVLTAGAAQALLKGNLVTVGHRVVVAGSGPFLLPVAAGLARAGAAVAGVYESARPGRFLRHASALTRNLDKFLEAGRYHATLLRRRVPVHTGWAVVAAHGEDRLSAVTVERLDRAGQPVQGTSRRVDCDTLAVGYGFSPQVDLLVQAGCGTHVDQDGSLVVNVDAGQCTDVAGVYAAGEVTGVGGAALAHVEGTIAGFAIRAAAGRPGTPPDQLLMRRESLRRFAVAVHDVYQLSGGWLDRLEPSTIVCRCEEVSLGQLRIAVEQYGAEHPRTAKLLTRAGMGWCQGRVCGHAVACVIEHLSGRPTVPSDHAAWAIRPFAQPIPLRLLADVKSASTPHQ